MTAKSTSLGVATLMLLLGVGAPQASYAEKTIKVDMQFAGAFSNSILRVDPFDPIGPPVASALIDVKTRGSLGKGVGQGFGGRGDTVEGPVSKCLGADGLFLKVTTIEDPLVWTFEDLSLLFATGPGVICVDLTTGKSVFEFNVMFTGGRGRFEGATGYAVIEGEAEPVSADGSLNGETGTMVGWLSLPKDFDDDDDEDSD